MSTSLHEAAVRFAAADLAVDRPFDVSLAQTVSNNVLHNADSNGQVLVSWNARVAATDYLPYGSNLVDTYVLMALFGPFWLRVKGATPYPLRVRVAGLSSNGVNSVTFALRATSGRDPYQTFVTAPTVNWVSASTSSSTSAWLTAGSTLLSPSPEDDSGDGPAARSLSVRLAIGGASGATQVMESYLALYGLTTNAGAEPRCTGVYASEYVGT